ncbi:GDSL esterase/lipase EXL3-like [Musa acuminata AAA Group]|uniref:GDSL esterase/lipase EXL3-like n=1 Tax=Musa acuminata AAA Group TaxID=214697 RepID=UPI0031D1C02A
MEEAAAGEETMGLRMKMASHSAPALFTSLLLLMLLLARAHGYSSNRTTGSMVPAVIAFGDSIVDPGNNDVLATTIRCDFPPYGQDFIDHQATGRFSNGLIPTDLIASGLGVKELLPPYLGVDLSPEDILTGVSFASGATGFDPITPEIVSVFSMTDELKLFAEYKEKLSAIAGEERGAEIVSEALYVVCAGTDDIANTYFTTPFRRPHYDIPSYVNLLIGGASDFIKQLHGMGARKIGFVGLPPIGCVPSQRTVGGGILRQCEETRNQAAQLYNSKIEQEIRRLSGEFGDGTKLVYIDIYDILLDLIRRPGYYGFKVSTKGCCGTGTIEVTLLCNSKTATVCSDVTDYVFWDSYHPTEKAYKIIVGSIFDNYIQFLV